MSRLPRRFRLSVLLGCLLALSSGSRAEADGLVFKLPEDGSWSSYFTTLKSATNEIPGSITIRSVGTEFVDGKDCRWIELSTTFEPPEGDKSQTIHKLLIPEQYLQKGKRPLEHLVRGWVKRGDEPPERIAVAREGLDGLGLAYGSTSVLLAGPLKEKKPVDKKRTVNYQHGQLSCSGFTGRLTFENPATKFETIIEETVWTSSKLSFGVAAIEGEVEILRDGENSGKLTFEVIINDIGQDAESALPDHH